MCVVVCVCVCVYIAVTCTSEANVCGVCGAVSIWVRGEGSEEAVSLLWSCEVHQNAAYLAQGKPPLVPGTPISLSSDGS